jgi:HSP20 family molecular chaperone IbpA
LNNEEHDMSTNQNIAKAERMHAESTLRQVSPAVDILEGQDEFHVVADLPGVPKGALKIEIENDELRLKAPATPFHDDDAPFEYARAFKLPVGIDASRVSADFKDGVLTLKLPKPAEMKPRRIDIQVA